MQEKIMEIVRRICGTKATNCRSLNKAGNARELLNLANVPDYAKIHEIPLDWDNQVVILFTVDETDENYYSLFAGIGNDGNFHFELTITGTWSDGYDGRIYFDFYEKEIELPIDWFIQRSPDTPKKGRHISAEIEEAELQRTEAYERGDDEAVENIDKWVANALAEGEELLADEAEAEIEADKVTISREDEKQIIAILGGLLGEPSGELERLFGSVGAESLRPLYQKLRFGKYCRENDIEYGEMTLDDYLDACGWEN